MKYFGIVLMLLLSMSFVMSASLEMDSEFNLGDNGVAKISANFYEPISLEDISFYRRHMSTSFENVETIKIGNEQFITFKVPLNKIEDIYSINMTVKENLFDQVQENDLSEIFSISNKTSSFYIEDNFLTVSGDYKIYLQNLLGKEITVNINPSSTNESSGGGFLASLFGKSSSLEGESVTLGAYERKAINFEVGDSSDLIKIVFDYGGDSQTVLVYENVIVKEEGEVEIIYPDNETEEVFIENENSSNEDEEETGESTLVLENETIYEGENSSILDGKNESYYSLKNCSELGGEICDANIQTCEGVVKEARDNSCCIGVCVEKKEDLTGKWVGWALLVIVIGSVGYAFMKNKGKKGKGFSLEKGKK